MTTANNDGALDPRARWRTLPPEPTEWIEEVDREHSAVDFAPDRKPNDGGAGHLASYTP
ncbi:hypothetical protein [Nocardia yunnanensis]|uniref:hypothetical protein n=1 Tax=Nocardia yunnanensis TaxID=2382165 RepID=UPI0013C43845|nr:hypothetical protein [Nocardia yunnanensis]